MAGFPFPQKKTYTFGYAHYPNGYTIYNMSRDEHDRHMKLIEASGVRFEVLNFLSDFEGFGLSNTGVNNYCLNVRF